MGAVEIIHVADALLGSDYSPSGPVRLTLDDGVIRDISRAESPVGRRLLAMPALINAHDHGRALSTTSFGCGARPLEGWLPSLAAIPSVDPYLSLAAALARAARGGCGGVMVHLTKPQGLTDLVDEAKEIARAAEDVGVPVGLAISIKDRNPLVYGDHETVLGNLEEGDRRVIEKALIKVPAPIDDQLAIVDAVADALADSPVDVQYGPNGVQWCSPELLEKIARASAETGRRVHMHLLETRYQRAWADVNFPDGIVPWLKSIGLLSPRLTLAHCVWSRPEEMDLIAESGARISVNPSSNLHLRSGIAPAAEMLRRNVAVAMGIDGCAFDEDDDGLREMRLFHLLNAGHGFDDDVGAGQVLGAVCGTGRATLGLPGSGVLAADEPADMLLLDLDGLDRDQVLAVDPRHYLLARARQSNIASLIVGGRHVVEDGRVTGVDLEAIETELRRQFRERIRQTEPLRQTWAALDSEIRAFYINQMGCC